MIIDMLEAVSMMLGLSLGEKREPEDPNVKCAQLMLNKIIEGMKRDEFIPQLIQRDLSVRITPPKVKPPKSDQYAIVPNDDGSIKEILDPSGFKAIEGRIELDGVEYTFAEVIGKKFQSGRIIG